MKKFHLLLLLVLSVFMVPLTGCDDDDDTNVVPSRTEILTNREWSGNSIYLGTSDVTQLVIDEVGFDISLNSIKFNSDGTFVDTYDGSTTNGTWEFSNNEQEILMEEDGEEFTVKINRLTDDELFLLYPGELLGLDSDIEVRYDR